MAFLLTTWQPDDENKQGIGVAVQSGAEWYLVPYEIDAASNADAWIVSNLAQIESDAPNAGAIIDPAAVAAALEDDAQDVSAIIDSVPDVADMFPSEYQRKVLKAIVLLMIDQFNTLRAEHGLSDITYQQAAQAIRNKYKSL